MSIRKVAFIEKEFYHIYNRGNSKQEIFLDEEDHERFVKLLYECNSPFPVHIANIRTPKNKGENQLVAIGAYTLMPNHFHILLTPITEGAVSKFMQKVSTAYSMYFNKKYQRTGGLFEGKFKSSHIDNDRYLRYLFSYIHLNPVKIIEPSWKEIGIKDKKKAFLFLRSYRYSSYLSYSTDVKEKIIAKEYFPSYFPNKQSFEKEMSDWITLKEY